MNQIQHIKKLINDPEYFITQLESKTEEHINEVMDGKTADWHSRNPIGTVSGSSLALCIRQAWYRYFSGGDTFTSYKSLEDKKRMYLGFVAEDEMGKALTRVASVLHVEQTKPPVNLIHPDIEDIRYSATTDFVCEYLSGGETYYIPMELKSTEMYKWKEFDYHPHHLKQLTLWIHYAKKNGFNVPFGVLHYVRRSDYSSKSTIVSVDVGFKKLGRSKVDFALYDAFWERQIGLLSSKIANKELPDMPTDVPKYLCAKCSFNEFCFSNMLLPDMGVNTSGN